MLHSPLRIPLEAPFSSLTREVTSTFSNLGWPCDLLRPKEWGRSAVAPVPSPDPQRPCIFPLALWCSVITWEGCAQLSTREWGRAEASQWPHGTQPRSANPPLSPGGMREPASEQLNPTYVQNNKYFRISLRFCEHSLFSFTVAIENWYRNKAAWASVKAQKR